MKYWGAMVSVLYAVLLIAVLVPLSVIILPDAQADTALKALFQRLHDWSFVIWLYFGAAVIAQAALLTMPVEAASKRPVTKRSIIPLVAAASLAMALLAAGAVFAIDEVIRKKALDDRTLAIVGAVFFVMWGFWARIFYLWSRKTGPMDLLSRQTKLFFKGSILELLIAVPSHIIARQRTYCCAGYDTFFGIAFGISVMLFSFGPGIFFLFAGHIGRLKRTP